MFFSIRFYFKVAFSTHSRAEMSNFQLEVDFWKIFGFGEIKYWTETVSIDVYLFSDTYFL